MPRLDPASAPTAPVGAHLPVELLRRYVAGQLPPAEEHAVEAHALDCALCADILQGLEMQPPAVTDASLQQLRQRLHTRVAAPTSPRVVPLWAWQPLAAAAVLLLSLGVAAWLVLRRAELRPETAAQRVAVPAPQSAPASPAADAAELSAAASAEVAAAPVVPGCGRPRGSASAASSRPPVLAQVTEADKPQIADIQADAPAGVASTSDPMNVSAPAAEARETTKSAAAGISAKARAAQPAVAVADAAAVAAVPTRTVQGRVTDAAGAPLPGATVLVPGTTTGTSTNADGTFSLAVPTTTPQLAVSSIGYTTQTRTLHPTDSTLALALVPDTRQLSEVVVRREAPPMLPSVAATPAGGYPSLRKYLRDSLNYPEKDREDRKEGTVRLRFVVSADGELRDIEVVRKVSPECDAEAVRLLKEGPAWFPTVQNNRRVARRIIVDVPFRMEQR